jgi:hypothetical protein
MNESNGAATERPISKKIKLSDDDKIKSIQADAKAKVRSYLEQPESEHLRFLLLAVEQRFCSLIADATGDLGKMLMLEHHVANIDVDVTTALKMYTEIKTAFKANKKMKNQADFLIPATAYFKGLKEKNVVDILNGLNQTFDYDFSKYVKRKGGWIQ